VKTCEYCRLNSGVIFGIEVRPCGRCSAGHFCCRDCWRKKASIVGEFPEQDYKLGKCPPRQEVVRGS